MHVFNEPAFLNALKHTMFTLSLPDMYSQLEEAWREMP